MGSIPEARSTDLATALPAAAAHREPTGRTAGGAAGPTDPAAPETPAAGVQVRQQEDRFEISTDHYTLLLDRATFGTAPYALLQDPAGGVWSALNLLSSVSSREAADEVFEVEGCEVQRDHDVARVVVRTRSTAWREHELTLTCRPEALELSVRVAGQGALTDVVLLGGPASLADGSTGLFASSINFASVLVPAPGEPVQLVRPSHSAGQLGVVGDADPGRLHAVFSPPPLALGLGRAAPTGATTVPDGDWLGLSLRAPVDELTFTTMTYAPLDGGFVLRLAYEGHTRVDGSWRSPVLVLRPAASGWDVLSDHRADLLEHGCASERRPPPVPWWREPIFCGWGAQCARVAAAARRELAAALPTPRALAPAVLPQGGPAAARAGAHAIRLHEHPVTEPASGLAREDVYEEFLTRLSAHGLAPGTVVVDDRWQAAYGRAEPDREHWPDLRGWVARQHEAGRRVLLWWKAWDPAGVPVQECIVDAAGRAVAVDPAHPGYRARLAATVAALLGPDGLDADGFKVDFTQRAPSGSSLRGHPGPWGIAALHTLLDTLSRAAKRAKPDALVVAHAVHPSFGDVCDMVRLNDLSRYDPAGRPVPVVDQLRVRHAIATRALPHHLVDTDQWPMPSHAEWRRYVAAQATLGVPALYYLESIDHTGEPIGEEDLAAVATSWQGYRQGLAR